MFLKYTCIIIIFFVSVGASGLLSNTLMNPIQSIQKPQNRWRYVFLASFCVTVNAFVNYLVPPSFHRDERSIQADDVPIPSTVAYLLGGFLVGLGTKIGNGCTTGHGICGLSRFSKRSLSATGTFTATGILTRYIISPLRSWASSLNFLRRSGFSKTSPVAGGLLMATTVVMAMLSPTLSQKNRPKGDDDEAEIEEKKTVGAALSGAMFAAGLAISGMTKNSKVHDFLCLSGLAKGTFDPTLAAVLGSGIFVSWASYQFVKEYSLVPEKALSCPANLGEKGRFSVPKLTNVDAELIGGSAIFG